MSATATPYGLQPISSFTGTIRPLVLNNGIASGLAANIFKYQALKLDTTNGTVTPVTATTDKIYGIFMGVEYTPTGQRPVVSDFWPTGSTYVAGLDKMQVCICPAWIPGQRFRIQADGTVPQGAFGDQFNLSNFSAGSTVSGLSALTAAATPTGIGVQGQLQLIEFGEGVNEAVGDAFTDLIVAISYPQIVSGFQTSPG